MNAQPAFNVTLASDQDNIVAGGPVTIQFNSERFDQANDFNTTTYKFTAPVTGKYQLNMSLSIEQMDTASTKLICMIVTSNVTYPFWLDPTVLGADPDYWDVSLIYPNLIFLQKKIKKGSRKISCYPLKRLGHLK